ncbi:MAG: lysylphosphatidylglycerol synthase transmembrane domain-containing protein [Acidimicrobiales bacterium]
MFDWVPRWLRWLFGALVLGLVVWLLVVPQFGDAERALDATADVHLGYVLLGGVLVAGAMVAQSELTRRVLPDAERPTLGTMVRVDLASTAVSHTVPGGTAAGTALAFRLLTRAGVTGPSTGFALAVRGIGSAVVLNVILWAALVVSIPAEGLDPRYTSAAVLGVLLLGFVGGAAIGLLRAREATTRLLVRILRPLPFVNDEGVPGVVDRLAEQLQTLVSDRRLALQATAWSAAYWLGLAASLWVLLYAFGWTGHPVSVLVAFGLVNVLAAIPITPRGLGVLEAVLIPMLIGFGSPASVATLGVISWRLLSFWAPIPLGTLSYVSIRIAQPEVRPDREALADELRTSASDRESWSQWAERHALRGPSEHDD